RGGPAPLRALALRGPRPPGGARGGRAQAPGERRPLGDRVASDDGSARVPEELDEEAADRAEADDDHRVAGLDARALHRPETARERLDERRGLVGHVAGQPEHGVTDVRRGHTHALREAPGIEVRRLERGTHRGAPAPAVVALAARHVMGGIDTVTDSYARPDGSE